MMVGIYFSGTGNTKYCVEKFMEAYGEGRAYSIEDSSALAEIQNSAELVIGYPIYYSNLPKIVRDFFTEHLALFQEKKVFLIATMGLFSGDGTGCGARVLRKGGAEIVGGLHLKMPDCIGDVKALKRSLAENQQLIQDAEQKIIEAAGNLKQGNPPQEGLNFFYHVAGLFGQRLWTYGKTREYSDKLRVDREACIGCGICVDLCPMQNLRLEEKKAVPDSRCTMCYRCISHCPTQAITLLGGKVIEQSLAKNYIQAHVNSGNSVNSEKFK